MDQLSPQDAQFLYMESADNLVHVTSISIFDPSTVPGGKTVRFRDIVGHVESRLHVSPLFRRRLMRVPFELDFPYWVDDEYFNLEYHIRHGRLPAPGDWRQFCIHMARYHARPLRMDRPLWEMFVVEGLDNVDGLPKGSYAIATKIHHAAVDGTAIIEFFGALADIDNRGTPAVSVDRVRPPKSPAPGLFAVARRALWHTVSTPLGMTDAVMRAAPTLYQVARDALAKQNDLGDSVPDTRFNCIVSPHRMFDAVAFSLDELKAVRAVVPGSTINDVVLAVCAGGLRRYLQHHGELPKESLVAWVPINARRGSAPDTQAPGNHITSMTTPLFTDVDDPVQRLRRIFEETQKSKQAKSGLPARLMTDLSQHVPSATQVMAARLILRAGVAAQMCNLFISNVPGPQVPLYMNGARQVRNYGLAPLANGMGLFIATPSYNGEITFNVTSTRETMPDIGFFIDCLKESMVDLLQASHIADIPKKRKTPRAVPQSPSRDGERPIA